MPTARQGERRGHSWDRSGGTIHRRAPGTRPAECTEVGDDEEQPSCQLDGGDGMSGTSKGSRKSGMASISASKTWQAAAYKRNRVKALHSSKKCSTGSFLNPQGEQGEAR